LGGTVSDRRRKTVNATVALLEAMPEAWLEDVLARLGARGAVVLEQPAEKRDRRCGVCDLTYPHHVARLHIDDHEWEEPRRKGTD
jgi:hypothetical protein